MYFANMLTTVFPDIRNCSRSVVLRWSTIFHVEAVHRASAGTLVAASRTVSTYLELKRVRTSGGGLLPYRAHVHIALNSGSNL